jgi:hypothetical protein
MNNDDDDAKRLVTDLHFKLKGSKHLKEPNRHSNAIKTQQIK